VNTTDVIGIVIAVVVLAAFAFVAWRGMQRRRLRDRFGDEYERVVAAKGRPGADSELRDRERRHARLDLHELTDAQRAHYRDGWLAVQERFVDDPVAAVRDGDRLVNELVSDRGYPASDYEDRLADLSVEHANVLNHYRDAHEISVRNEAGTATTEQLRQSLVHYRELFTALLGEQPARQSTSTANAGPTAPATGGAPAANVDATADGPPADVVPAHRDSTGEEPAGESVDRSDVDSVAAGTRGSASRVDAYAPPPDSATPDTPPHAR
jgi:hypothetical protein